MGIYKEHLLEVINRDFDKEIDELSELIEILSDSNSITDTDSLNVDIEIMEKRRGAFQDAKMMVYKASLKITDFDNEKLMTPEEKKWFYKLVRIIRFIRRAYLFFKDIFKKKK